MGNTCDCVCRQTDDDAEDALLASFEGEMTDSSGQPRGPPPPYQVQHTFTHTTPSCVHMCCVNGTFS